MSVVDPTAIPSVQMLARIIPTGIEHREDGTRCLATLVLMPWVPDADASAVEAFPVAAWPAEVQKKLQHLQVCISPVKRDADTVPVPNTAHAGHGIKATASVTRSTQSCEAATKLWSRLMGGDSALSWTALATALRERQSGDTLQQVQCGGASAPAPTAESGAACADHTAQPATEPTHPDVFAYPRADAALLYGFERAREVLRAMKGECRACKVGSAAIRTGGRQMDAASFTFRQKPWLGLDAPTIRIAENGMSDASFGASSLQGFALRDKALVDERRAQEDAYRRQLSEKAGRAKNLANARQAYLTASSPSARATALERHAAQRATSLSPSACSDACGPTTDDGVAQRLTDDVKATHSLGSLPDVDESGDATDDSGPGLKDAFEAAADAAAQRLFAIAGMPSLARMLNFVFDIEFSLDDLLQALGCDQASARTGGFREWGVIDHFADLTGIDAIPPRTGCQDDAHYLFISLQPAGDVRQIWTLAKFRVPRPEEGNGEAGHFWPCTREEVDLRLADIARREATFTIDTKGADIRGSCAVFQFDGVVDLGVTACDDTGVRNPRYDVVSLDTINTVESDIQSDRRMKSRADAAARGSATSGDLGVQTRRTGGFALLDRWRQDHVVSQIVTARDRLAPDCAVVLDAEDLTSGYRLDVGVQPSSGAGKRRIWRSLMNRTMQFEGKSGPLEQHIAELYGWPDPHDVELTRERRRRADSASLSLAARLRNNGGEREGRAAKTVFAEEIMVAWHGDPLGLDCLSVHGVDAREGGGGSGVAAEDTGISMPAEHLPLEIHYGLETGHKAYKPPSLRYGRRYYFGLRPVYLGGVVLPLELAISRYERTFDGGSALPAPNLPKSSGRRFLRHERIEAPLLTVPAKVAAAVLKDAPDLDDLHFDRARIETGATCLLRTSLRRNADIYPDATIRILVPPILPLEQAALHGVFDKAGVETVVFKTKLHPWSKEKSITLVRPTDGLKALDFSGDVDPESGEDRGGFPHYTRKSPSLGEPPRGPAVFRLRPGGRPRHVPFYPDPAALSYVVAARRPNSSDYLCKPLRIDTVGHGVVYPDVLPLAIEVRKRSSTRSGCLSDVRQLVLSQSTARIDADGDIHSSGAGMPAIHLVLGLDPGEDFELEVWCAPSKMGLENTFDIIESLAVLLTRESATEGFAEGRLDDACVASLRAHLPDLEADFDSLKGESNPLCGPGGMTLPQGSVLRIIAKAVADALVDHPIPELAATTRLRITHAVDLPNQAPHIEADLRLSRLRTETMDALFAPEDSTPLAACEKATRLQACDGVWEQLADDGATNAIFAGTLRLDPLTTQDVAIHATLVSPASAVFDDVKRGRSAEEKARGAYRPPGTVPDLARVAAWPKLPTAFSEAESMRLFGFSVGGDGRVKLPRVKAPLAALHDLPDVRLSARESPLHPHCLLDIQTASYRHDVSIRIAPPPDPDKGVPPSSLSWEDPADRPGRVQYLQPFHDGLARRLDVVAVATSRFASLFPPPKEAATASPDAMAVSKIEKEPKSDPVQRLTVSNAVSIWLPATRRPDRLPARSLRPSFVWTTPSSPALPVLPRIGGRRRLATAVRTCSIHVPFARPHFTSGEGERVGVVIWPPDLLDGASEAGAIPSQQISSDSVRRSGQPRSAIKLDDMFSDSDLGPGGPFVTRWGADPIRQGPRPGGWLIPANAFLDWDEASSGGVRFAPNILMPIPRERSDPGKESDAAGREFMLVSLLTYKAKFDIDHEHWFIDVAIDTDVVPEPFIRLGLVRFQPHARRELQCSEPIAEWVQVMPRRTVCVDLDDTMARAGEVDLAIEVSSPARYESPEPLDPGAAVSPGRVPIMRATVLRTDTSADGKSAIQTVVRTADSVEPEPTVLDMRRTADGTVWSGPISFAHRPPPVGAVRYALYLEEVEIFESTADPVDPETGVERPATVETGPRFAAIVDLPLPPPEPHALSQSSGPKHPQEHEAKHHHSQH